MLLEVLYPDMYMLTPILSILVILILLIFMIYLYMKMRVWPVMLIVYLFSLVIGMNSIATEHIPYTPYFQIFFLLIQSVIFIITSFELYKKPRCKK